MTKSLSEIEDEISFRASIERRKMAREKAYHIITDWHDAAYERHNNCTICKKGGLVLTYKGGNHQRFRCKTCQSLLEIRVVGSSHTGAIWSEPYEIKQAVR